MSRLNNLVYLCGPHGSGKTTLEQELARGNPRILVPELFSQSPKFHVDPEYRQALKLCERAIENFEYLQTAKSNPDKIILANRCVYDVRAYHWVYHENGWTDDRLFNTYNSYAKEFFRHENAEPFAIVLNPGLDKVMSHLKQRAVEKGKKWREDDVGYARLACAAYEQLRNRPNILYIDHEINLTTKQEVTEANIWLEKIFSAKTNDRGCLYDGKQQCL